eukprot:4683190-Prorocentrum_lima.AAC.1
MARYAHYPTGDNVLLKPVSWKKSCFDESKDSSGVWVHRDTGAIYGECAIIEKSLVRAVCVSLLKEDYAVPVHC